MVSVLGPQTKDKCCHCAAQYNSSTECTVTDNHCFPREEHLGEKTHVYHFSFLLYIELHPLHLAHNAISPFISLRNKLEYIIHFRDLSQCHFTLNEYNTAGLRYLIFKEQTSNLYHSQLQYLWITTLFIIVW